MTLYLFGNQTGSLICAKVGPASYRVLNGNWNFDAVSNGILDGREEYHRDVKLLWFGEVTNSHDYNSALAEACEKHRQDVLEREAQVQSDEVPF